MKKHNSKVLVIAAAAFFSVFISACEKEPVRGCMNSKAENFNVDAEEDNGTCKFKAKVLVWQYKTNSDKLVAAGSKTLTVFFDNVSVGSFAASENTGSSPASCSGTAPLVLTYDMGNTDTKNVAVVVKDETGKQVFTRNTTFYADHSCVSIYLE